MFNCPNCRAITNLEEEDEAEQVPQDELDQPQSPDDEGRLTNGVADHSDARVHEDTDSVGPVTGDLDMEDSELAGAAETALAIDEPVEDAEESAQGDTTSAPRPTSSGLFSRRQASNPSSPHVGADSLHDLEIPTWGAGTVQQTSSSGPVTAVSDGQRATTPTLDALSQEGPLTPRNNAGPFVFDGSGGRAAEPLPSS